jgi:hypothetical protein
MSGQVTITQLPTASALTGAELVPVVQNGVTVQTTTSAIAGAGALNYPFLTVGSAAGLTQGRYLSASTGLSLSDTGAGGTLTINMTGAASSLNAASTGIIVKDSASTVANRSLAVGSGMTISNADGVSGNPTLGLSTILQNLASATSAGILALNGTTITAYTLQSTTSQTSITNGNGVGGAPTVGLADDPIVPGSGSITIPSGTTAQRIGSNGSLRYNSQLGVFEGYANNAWGSIVTGSGVTSILTGTGLTGGPITSTGTISIDSTVVTLTGTQTLTNKTLTAPIISTISNTGTLTLPTTTDTLVGRSTTDTLSNKTLVNPQITGTVQLTGSGASAYTPFIQTFSSSVTNFNGYQLSYIQNTNNGSDASVDYVAYNDASDVDSYFIDMGISSSNYTNALYTIFPANGAYLYTGGGTSGQAAPLLLGTSNAASDITFFTGGTLLANTRATIKGNTGNFLINTTTDTGYKLNVNGTTYFGGASTFGSTVLLNANPTLALQAATKQYVDAAVSTGFVVHTAVVYATTAALPTNTYNNGTAGVGATLTATANGALSVDGNAVTTSQRILVKNEAAQANNGAYVVTQTGSAGAPYILTRATDFNTAAAGNIANNAYFFITGGATNAGDSYVLSQTAAITVGTTALPFTLFADQAVYTGGTNITVAGQTISVSGTIAATLGGTGTSTVTTGDLLYGSATNTWSKLPLGIGYKSLVVNAAGTQIEWNAVALNQSAAVSGQLGVSNGGTSFSSYTTGDIIYASGSTTLAKLTLGTSSYVLTAGASAPAYVAQSTLSVGTATNATNTTNVALTAGSGATNYIHFSSAATGNQATNTNTLLTYNYTNNAFTAGISGGAF